MPQTQSDYTKIKIRRLKKQPQGQNINKRRGMRNDIKRTAVTLKITGT